jgi:hypothetical protein
MNLDYIAGFFDGEGSVMAATVRKPEACYGFQIRPMIEIAQKRPEVLHEIQRFFDFGYVYHAKAGVPHDCSRFLVVDRKNCRAFIEAIGPLSRIKQEQLFLLKTVIENGTRPHGGIIDPIPKIKLLKAIDAIEKLRSLNTTRRKARDPIELRHIVLDFDIEEWKIRRSKVLKAMTQRIITQVAPQMLGRATPAQLAALKSGREKYRRLHCRNISDSQGVKASDANGI